MKFHSSRPDHWTSPRPYTDASLRLMKHGPIQGMSEPGLLSQLVEMFRGRKN